MDNVEKYIEDNIEYLEKDNFEHLYDFWEGNASSLTQYFLDNGIDPLDYLYSVPTGYANRLGTVVNVSFNDDIRQIGTRAFADSGVTTVNFNNVTTLGTNCFERANYLEEAVMPNVESLSAVSFYHCARLKKVVFGKNIKIIPTSCFEGCKELTDIDFGGVVRFAVSAFYGALKSVKSLTIPDGATQIGEYAFGNTGLKEIWLPESIIYFGDGAVNDNTVIHCSKRVYDSACQYYLTASGTSGKFDIKK